MSCQIRLSKAVLNSRVPWRNSQPTLVSLRPICAPSIRKACANFSQRRAFTATSPRSASTGPPPGPRKPQLPILERLIIHGPNPGRLIFLGCLKLTTVFVFLFFAGIVVPIYAASDEPIWKTAALVACGTIPVLFVTLTTSPYVVAVHVRLPVFARTSVEMLRRFAKNPPPDTKLEISTLNLIGKPRVTQVLLKDLRPVRQRVGLVNYARETKADDVKRPWWRLRAVGGFYIARGGEKKIKMPWIWPEIQKAIDARSKQG